MYYARKAEPKASKLLFKKEVERRQQLHRAKLRSMKASVDNKAPRRFKHMKRNLKKEQMMEDRFAQIEHENRILLSKMSDIMQGKNTLDNKSEAATYAHSLNRDLRKRELQRITQENQAILFRIQNKEPVYNHYEWETDRLEQEKILKNIQEYKSRPADVRRATSKMVGGVLPPDEGLDADYARESRERLHDATYGSEEDHFPEPGARGGSLAPLGATT